MGKRSSSLWRHADFLKLWAGQTVSLFGSQITLLALPLTAVLTLKATPGEMGILVALSNAPNLLSFLAGAWVDRLRRKPVLILADLGRALVLLSIPLGAALHVLRIELLYPIALLLGVLTVVFDVAYGSLLPSLIERDQLVEGNSKLQVSDAAARVVGPGIGGALVQLLTAPIAVAFDAVSFLASVLSLLLIRTAEPPAPTQEQRESLRKEVLEGARFVFRHPLLRPMLIFNAVWNFSDSIIFAVYVLYATRDLGLGPGVLGLTFTLASVGFLVGATIASRVQRHLGLGPAIVLGGALEGLGVLLVPVSHGPVTAAAVVLGAAQFIIGLGFPFVGIGMVSVRQAITPDRMLGRVVATSRSITWGVLPLGNLLGGVLGSVIGLHGAIVLGAGTGSIAFLALLFSPVRTLGEAPGPSDQGTQSPSARRPSNT